LPASKSRLSRFGSVSLEPRLPRPTRSVVRSASARKSFGGFTPCSTVAGKHRGMIPYLAAVGGYSLTAYVLAYQSFSTVASLTVTCMWLGPSRLAFHFRMRRLVQNIRRGRGVQGKRAGAVENRGILFGRLSGALLPRFSDFSRPEFNELAFRDRRWIGKMVKSGGRLQIPR
jgi:hypothetical protein